MGKGEADVIVVFEKMEALKWIETLQAAADAVESLIRKNVKKGSEEINWNAFKAKYKI